MNDLELADMVFAAERAAWARVHRRPPGEAGHDDHAWQVWVECARHANRLDRRGDTRIVSHGARLGASAMKESTVMHTFLANNREMLIQRCTEKVALRPLRNATPEQLKNGIPLFLSQLERTLVAEELGMMEESARISGQAGGGPRGSQYEMGVSAAAHGLELHQLGYTIDQVVHDYGDLCQAVADLAIERDAPFSVNEFRTLNRSLDNAISLAVTEFSAAGDRLVASKRAAELKASLGYLVHELRNALSTAMLAVTAMEGANLPVTGSTGAVLKRSHAALKTLVDQALVDVRGGNPAPDAEVFPVAQLLADAQSAAALLSATSGNALEFEPADAHLSVCANRQRVLAALGNLLQNALKFTRPGTSITVRATGVGDKVQIQVADQCGGLPPGSAQTMFSPFSQRSTDKSGLGIGLSIARGSIEADGGTLTVADVPGKGCIFTICLERRD